MLALRGCLHEIGVRRWINALPGPAGRVRGRRVERLAAHGALRDAITPLRDAERPVGLAQCLAAARRVFTHEARLLPPELTLGITGEPNTVERRHVAGQRQIERRVRGLHALRNQLRLRCPHDAEASARCEPVKRKRLRARNITERGDGLFLLVAQRARKRF